MLKKLFYHLAKGFFMGKIVGNAFRYCSWAIPVKKVYNDKEILVFYHPRPSYEKHMIISPKRAIKNLQQMELAFFSGYFVKILEVAKDIYRMHPEYSDSFILVANGGKRQEVQQVHFHMFTKHEIVKEYLTGEQREGAVYSDENICVLKHPKPNWEIHFVIKPIPMSMMVGNEEDKEIYFRSVLHSINYLDTEFNLVQKGYSLIYRWDGQSSDVEYPVFHIVAGKRREAS